jgi:hypothetical protein
MNRPDNRRRPEMRKRPLRVSNSRWVDQYGHELFLWKLCKGAVSGTMIGALLFFVLGLFRPDDMNNVGLLATLMLATAIAIPSLQIGGRIFRRWLSRRSSH